MTKHTYIAIFYYVIAGVMAVVVFYNPSIQNKIWSSGAQHIIFVGLIIVALYQLKANAVRVANDSERSGILPVIGEKVRDTIIPQLIRYWGALFVLAVLTLMYTVFFGLFLDPSNYSVRLAGVLLFLVEVILLCRTAHAYVQISFFLNSLDARLQKEIMKDKKRQAVLDELKRDKNKDAFKGHAHLKSYSTGSQMRVVRNP